MSIHPTSIIDPGAEVGSGVEIGPFCIVEKGAILGDGCILEARCSVKQDTHLGKDNRLGEGVVLGGLPQHLKAGAQVGGVRIGNGNKFHENATVNRALKQGEWTVLGDGNLMMANSHVAHDCVLGSNIVIANSSALAGHVTVGDRAFISAYVGVHQFCRVGRSVMVGAFSKVIKDIPPFVLVDGTPCYVVGLNSVGLRRAGFTLAEIKQLKAAYLHIYRSGKSWDAMLASLEGQFQNSPAAEMHTFFTAGSSRGFVPERRMPPNATLKLRHGEEHANTENQENSQETRASEARQAKVG